MNRRAEFYAASFILSKEIRNRTNKQTYKQTVNDISYRHVWIIITGSRVFGRIQGSRMMLQHRVKMKFTKS